MRAALSVALVAGVASPAPARAAASTATRLLVNAGFESGLASWTADSDWVSAVVSPTRTGTGAARIVDTSTAAGAGLRSASLAVVPGERITAGIWVRQATAGAGGSLYLEFRRPDGSRTTPAVSVPATSTSWQQLTVVGDVPDDAVTADLLAYSSWADQGTTYWDDAAVSALPPPLRRVPNGGFEEQRDAGRPTQWTTDQTGVALVRGGAAHSGDTAVRITDTSAGDAVSVLSKAVPVGLRETITASAWASVLSGSAATLYLEFRDVTGARVGFSTAVASGAGWRPVTVTATAPPSATTVTVRLYSLLEQQSVTTWDDVTLRSSADVSYAPELAAGAPVLFVGDQRVESYTGVTRELHAGTKAGTDGVVLGGGSATHTANPRMGGTVLAGGPGDPAYKMWFTGSPTAGTTEQTGYATSPDGLTWTHAGRLSGIATIGGVVANPAWSSGSTVPRYFALEQHRSPDQYRWKQSADGIAWADVPGSTPLAGADVATVTYDPIARLFVAMIKRHLGIPLGTRTTWVSTSTDFKVWSPPRPAFATDGLDDELIAGAGKKGQTPWSEVYGMPAIRYGDQYLGTPWIFDITYSPNRDAGDNGPDKGRSHLGLAASRDLVNWSRPNRGELIVPGAPGTWDYGFQLGSNGFVTVRQPDGDLRTRFYYGSFAGEHYCLLTNRTAGECDVESGNSKIGMVSWPTDRFASFRGAGSVITRPLTPTGTKLAVNYAPTGGSRLTVEVLDINGNPFPGYEATVTTDAKAPGVLVVWAGHNELPGGPIRLRFTQNGGDLYAYTVS